MAPSPLRELHMIPANFDDLTFQHLQDLVTQLRREDQTIEFKRTLPGVDQQERVRWLLKPVCSFANSQGGDLLLGMTAEEGLATEVTGVEIADPDQQVMTLDQILRANLDPVVPGIRVRALAVPGIGRHVVVVRVPASWNQPHRLKVNGKFYARGSAGSFELDMPQLRQSFLLSNSLATSIQNFRSERIARIVSGDTPVATQDGIRVIVHILPVSSFSGSSALSAEDCLANFVRVLPRVRGGMTREIGIEGMTVYDVSPDGSRTYTQVFREGRIEHVEIYRPDGNFLPSVDFERVCIDSVREGIRFLTARNFGNVYFVGLAIVNAKGYELGLGQMVRFYHGDDARPFSKDTMIFSMIELSGDAPDIARALRPVFDHVWNAAGMPKSLNYDEAGAWSENRQR